MDNFPSDWLSVIEADAATEPQPHEPQPQDPQRQDPQPHEPLSDAYLAGMTPRRRRRERATRPPQEAAAFIQDCMSLVTEGGVDNSPEEESLMFLTFYEYIRTLAEERAATSEDFRPTMHLAVAKLLENRWEDETTSS